MRKVSWAKSGSCKLADHSLCFLQASARVLLLRSVTRFGVLVVMLGFAGGLVLRHTASFKDGGANLMVAAAAGMVTLALARARAAVALA